MGAWHRQYGRWRYTPSINIMACRRKLVTAISTLGSHPAGNCFSWNLLHFTLLLLFQFQYESISHSLLAQILQLIQEMPTESSRLWINGLSYRGCPSLVGGWGGAEAWFQSRPEHRKNWGFSWFTSAPPGNCKDSSSIRQWPLPSKFFPIHPTIWRHTPVVPKPVQSATTLRLRSQNTSK
jgi:hypothetical protein